MKKLWITALLLFVSPVIVHAWSFYPIKKTFTWRNPTSGLKWHRRIPKFRKLSYDGIFNRGFFVSNKRREYKARIDKPSVVAISKEEDNPKFYCKVTVESIVVGNAYNDKARKAVNTFPFQFEGRVAEEYTEFRFGSSGTVSLLDEDVASVKDLPTTFCKQFDYVVSTSANDSGKVMRIRNWIIYRKFRSLANVETVLVKPSLVMLSVQFPKPELIKLAPENDKKPFLNGEILGNIPMMAFILDTETLKISKSNKKVAPNLRLCDSVTMCRPGGLFWNRSLEPTDVEQPGTPGGIRFPVYYWDQKSNDFRYDNIVYKVKLSSVGTEYFSWSNRQDSVWVYHVKGFKLADYGRVKKMLGVDHLYYKVENVKTCGVL